MATGIVASVATKPPAPSKRRYQKGSLQQKQGNWWAVVDASQTPTSNDSPELRVRRWVKLGAMAEYPAPDDIAPLFAAFMLSFNQALMPEGVSPHLLSYIDPPITTRWVVRQRAGCSRARIRNGR